MRTSNLAVVTMLVSMVQLHAVRDSRLDKNDDPAEDVSRVLASSASPCGGILLGHLQSPQDPNEIVSHAWKRIDSDVESYIKGKQESLEVFAQKISSTQEEIRSIKLQIAAVPAKPSASNQRIDEMLGEVCTEEFGQESSAQGLDACNTMACGFDMEDFYDQAQFAERFMEKFGDELRQLNFTHFYTECDEKLKQSEEEEMEYDMDSNWCRALCIRTSTKVMETQTMVMNPTIVELQKTLTTRNEELRILFEQHSTITEEITQCQDAQTSINEFTSQMHELSEDHSTRSHERQVIQFNLGKASRRLKQIQKEVVTNTENHAKAMIVLDVNREKERILKDTVIEYREVENRWVEKVERLEKFLQDVTDDLAALNDAKDAVNQFKSALSLILLKMLLLYDSSVNNPLKRLLVSDLHLREIFVQTRLVVSGQSGDTRLVEEIEDALLAMKMSCGFKTETVQIQLKGGRLLLPSEARGFNTSHDDQELLDLMRDFPLMDLTAVDLPDTMLSMSGLPDVCENTQVQDVSGTMDQILQVVDERRNELLAAFDTFVTVATQELDLVATGGHYHHIDDINEREYECDHEPKWTQRFKSNYGRIDFFTKFVAMWAHADEGRGLSYFMKLEAMLEYLYLVASAKKKDHTEDLRDFKEARDAVSEKLSELIVKLEEAVIDTQMSHEAHEFAASLLEETKIKHRDAELRHAEFQTGLTAANAAVQAALDAAAEKHEAALAGTGKSSLLSIALKKVHKMRQNGKSQIASNKKSELKKEEQVGLYGNDASAWRKEARELEAELERLRKGAVYLPFRKL